MIYKVLSMFSIIFLPLYLFSVELTFEEKTYLEKLSPIKVCVDPDWAPFETLSAKGEYVGIGADLLFLVAQRLGMNIEIYKTKDWDETMIASKEGKCQIMSFLNQTPARDKWLIFTEPHFSDPNVFITREEHPFIAETLATLSIKPLFFQREQRWKKKSVKNIPTSR